MRKFFVFLLFWSRFACADFPFRAIPYIPAVHASQAIAADIDQDHVPDIILLEGFRIAVMKGNGDKSFLPPVMLANLKGFRAIAVAQLNADTYPDIAAIEKDHGVLSVYLNQGNGTFFPLREYKLRGLPLGFAAGDLNGDSIDDFAIAIDGEPSGFVQVLLGSTDGTLMDFKTFTTPAPTSVALGHFDQDERLDLAVTSFHEPTVAILRGNGNGEFTSLRKIAASAGANKILSCDLDQDGSDDLVVLNIYNQVVFARNTGNARFETPRTFQLERVQDAVIFTHTGQQHPSVLVRDGYQDIVIFTRTPSGYSQRHFLFAGSAAMAAADWDGDGQTELAMSVSSYIALIETEGNRLLLPRHLNFAVAEYIVDFNQDGHEDLVGSGFLLLGNGKGKFKKERLRFDTGDFVRPIFINDDAAPDLLIVHFYRDTTFRLNDRNGSFGSEHLFPYGYPLDGVLKADLNHDRHNDLITLADLGVFILLGRGKGMFADPMKVPLFCDPPLVYDLDDDGQLDLIEPCFDFVALRYGNGDGTFQPEVLLNDEIGIDNPSASDWNGDGISDLLLLGGYDPGVADLFLGLGGRAFDSPQRYAAPYLPIASVSADFNQDGLLDLVVLGDDSALALYYGTGDRSGRSSFTEPVFFGAGRYFTSLAIGDFNEDGAPDIVASSHEPNRTVLFLNRK